MKIFCNVFLVRKLIFISIHILINVLSIRYQAVFCRIAELSFHRSFFLSPAMFSHQLCESYDRRKVSAFETGEPESQEENNQIFLKKTVSVMLIVHCNDQLTLANRLSTHLISQLFSHLVLFVFGLWNFCFTRAHSCARSLPSNPCTLFISSTVFTVCIFTTVGTSKLNHSESQNLTTITISSTSPTHHSYFNIVSILLYCTVLPTRAYLN